MEINMAQNRLNTGQGLRTFTVSRQELLAKLRENRVKHENEYREAVEEYKRLAKLEVQTKLENIKNQFGKLYHELDQKPIQLAIEENLYFDISPPESHVGDFDEIIEAFEWETEDKVELTSVEFSNYVRNNWDFNKKLQETRAFYASKSLSIGSSRP
jgi:hypothetical protein